MKIQTEKRLSHIFRQLPVEDQRTLLAFAEFLESRISTQIVKEINKLPRPAEETVISAIKRLSHTYPMVDKSHIFGETSALMTQHIMQGRKAVEVIDELENVFFQHYEKFIKNKCEKFEQE
jgi:hypothetical protein